MSSGFLGLVYHPEQRSNLWSTAWFFKSSPLHARFFKLTSSCVVWRLEEIRSGCHVIWNNLVTFAPHFGAIAQLVEQRTENPCVPGSIPGGTTNQARLRVSPFSFNDTP